MTKSEAIEYIKLRLGSRDDIDLDPLIASQIASDQLLLEAAAPYPWFCLSERSIAATVANEPRIPVPSDFVIEVDDQSLDISFDGEVTWVRLDKADWDSMITGLGEVPGRPKAYALRGNYFVLGPPPDAIYSLRMTYQGRDTAFTSLTDGGTNQWLTQAHDYLLSKAGMAVAGWIKDAPAQAQFSEYYKLAYARYMQLATAREEANRIRKMGDV